MFKIYKGFDKVIWYSPLKLSNNQKIYTRGHGFKYNRDNFNVNYRYHFFTNRVAKDWSSLPNEFLDISNTNSFKNNIDGLFDRYGTYSFGSTGNVEFQRSLW